MFQHETRPAFDRNAVWQTVGICSPDVAGAKVTGLD